MKLNKWNYDLHCYEDYIVPDNVYVSKYETDMKKKVNCCNCFKEVEFGKTYTSLTIHDEIGLGYAICNDCYDNEIIDRIRAEERLK